MDVACTVTLDQYVTSGVFRRGATGTWPTPNAWHRRYHHWKGPHVEWMSIHFPPPFHSCCRYFLATVAFSFFALFMHPFHPGCKSRSFPCKLVKSIKCLWSYATSPKKKWVTKVKWDQMHLVSRFSRMCPTGPIGWLCLWRSEKCLLYFWQSLYCNVLLRNFFTKQK